MQSLSSGLMTHLKMETAHASEILVCMYQIGFEVLTDVTIKIRIIWVVMPCGFAPSITA
jgi:hypothetical protein